MEKIKLFIRSLFILICFSCTNQAEIKLKAGKEMLEKKDFNGAKKLLDEAILKDPKLFEAHLFRAISNDSLRNYDDAIKDYFTAISINDSCSECYNNIGRIYLMDSLKFEKAEQYFTKAINLKNDYVVAIINRAKANYSLKKANDAFNDYLLAINIDNNCAECYFAIGHIYWWDSLKFEKAEQNFTKAINLKNDYWEAYLGRANVYASMNQKDNALKDFTKTIEISPDNAMVYFSRGLFYRNGGNKEESINDFKNAVKYDNIDKKGMDPYLFLLPLLCDREDYIEAEKYASMAISKFPNDEYYYSQRGAIRLSLEHYADAILDLTKALEINPESGDNYFFRAMAEYSINELEKACKDVKKSISLNFKPAEQFVEDYCK